MFSPAITWVVLTMGTRMDQFWTAVESVYIDHRCSVTAVNNGGAPAQLEVARIVDPDRFDRVDAPENVGVPGGRDLGLRSCHAPIVGFLDDDAEFRDDMTSIIDAFSDDPGLGVVALRLVDEQGQTARRHVPQAGATGVDVPREVAYFLGGACAIRREAYEQVGGYFTELFYGHEEIELSWRLIDAGWKIRYLADVEVFHPRTEISRHSDGWRLTGRNRVWIARRTLPWPVALVHVLVWLVLGLVRAPKGACREAYRRGWMSGWKGDIPHRPVSWRTVWRLTRLGRPPIV